MKPEEARQWAALWMAQATGTQLQNVSNDGTLWHDSLLTLPNKCELYQWRIKPKPTLRMRPWLAEEVPIGAQIRAKCAPHSKVLICAVFAGRIYDSSPQVAGWVSNYDYEYALARLEHSTDGGKNWLPCGVERTT